MIGSYDNISVCGMAAAVPTTVIDNANLVDILGERRCKRQIRLTGIRYRHVSINGQRASDLCFCAATRLLKKLDWSPDSISVLLMVTQNPDFILPSTAFFMQKHLGISKDCVAFDINLGCSGTNVGLQTAASLLQMSEEGGRALVLVGDAVPLCSDTAPDAVANNMLFGSAGCALAVEKKANNRFSFMTKSDGSRYQAILRDFNSSVQMDGQGVFEFGVNEVADDIVMCHEKFGLSKDEVDFYVFHQAQQLMLDTIIDNAQLPAKKELRSLQEYGNTNGSSIPVSICANTESIIRMKTAQFFTCGFGVGLSWGISAFSMDTQNILPIIVSDEIIPRENG